MEALLQNLIRATGWSILHSLWQGAIIYGILLLVQTGAGRMKSKTKYILAFGASSLMFLCFVSTFLMVFDWSDPAQTNTAVASNYLIYHLPAVPPTLSQYAEMLFPYLVCLYAGGILIQSILVINGYIKISALKKGPHLQIPENWNVLFETLTRKMGIKANVRFWLSDQVQVPLIIGYLKPVVLFPIALATQMDLNQVEAILIHELSHIRRNDYLFNLIRTMISTVLFFNPFIWLTGKFIDIEREHACDDLVVELTHTPMTYAHALLKLEILTDKSSPILSLAATGNKQYLYQRIKRITDMKTNYMNSKQKLFAISLTIATVISLAWIKPSKAEMAVNSALLNHHTAKPSLKEEITHTLSTAFSMQQEQPADTSKKKLKKKVNHKTSKNVVNSLTVVPSCNVDTAITITINEALKPLEKIHFNLDSVANVNINGWVQSDNDALKIKSDGSKLSATQKGMVISGSNGTYTFKGGSPNYIVLKNKGQLTAQQKAQVEALQKQMEAINKKMQKELSPIERVKMEKLVKNMKANLYSPQQLASIQKLGQEMANKSLEINKIVGSVDFQNRIQELKIKHNMPVWNYSLGQEDPAVNSSPEYQALKKKFDADVKALKDKKAAQEKAKDGVYLYQEK